jgi:phosphoglycolate phosphatase-like HAD superfamily hydrolase
MNQVRAVIFDFDGTLANTQEAIRSGFIEALKDIEAPLTLLC